jgi:glycosyltransferase involved in cell wall biosynthesis
MSPPLLSIVVPTRDRHDLLRTAVDSALGQTIAGDVEVVVVDDASVDPVRLPGHPHLRVVRRTSSTGGSGARNAGTAAAAGRFVGYLDDDDTLYPHFAEVSLTALERTTMPPPVAVLSGCEAVTPDGTTLEVKRPQASPRGRWYALDDPLPGRSFHAKQSLVVERAVVEGVGGWDERFRSRVHTELFLRLNRACSLDAIDEVTYRLLVHPGPRVSKDPELRQRSFEQLLTVHREGFATHPRGAARFLVDHAEQSWHDRRRRAALRAAAEGLRHAPLYTAREVGGRLLRDARAGRGA